MTDGGTALELWCREGPEARHAAGGVVGDHDCEVHPLLRDGYLLGVAAQILVARVSGVRLSSTRR